MINHLFVKLTKPSSVFIGEGDWKIADDFEIDGIPVDGNDTPWCAFGDLLIDRSDRRWVGMSFILDDSSYVPRMLKILEFLDPACIECFESSRNREEKVDRIDITWANARDRECVIAQLLCGQWFWWYATEGDWGICKPVVAFGINVVCDVLEEFNLVFPTDLKFGANLRVRSSPPG
jgi:hypothetical protein